MSRRWYPCEDANPLASLDGRPELGAGLEVVVGDREHCCNFLELNRGDWPADLHEFVSPRFGGSASVIEHRHDADVPDAHCDRLLERKAEIIKLVDEQTFVDREDAQRPDDPGQQ